MFVTKVAAKRENYEIQRAWLKEYFMYHGFLL